VQVKWLADWLVVDGLPDGLDRAEKGESGGRALNVPIKASIAGWRRRAKVRQILQAFPVQEHQKPTTKATLAEWTKA
jgi:hypothetical protein